MSRIAYALLTNEAVAGGQKVIMRHVETLVDLGFDAVCMMDAGSRPPRWFEHRAPILPIADIRDEDILVVPDDGPAALAFAAQRSSRSVVLCQSSAAYLAGAGGLRAIAQARARIEDFLVVSAGHAETVRRLFPWARPEVVRCFADERLFRPGAKQFTGALVARKRPLEAKAIRELAAHLHPGATDLGWRRIENATEAQVAATFAEASIYLSLSRMESVGLTTLEAMASGCVCAGFTGLGGDQYATAENGFWAPEDDCLAAADALAAAINLVRRGGPALSQLRDAGYETARQWSYAAFRQDLDAAWTRLAPSARRG